MAGKVPWSVNTLFMNIWQSPFVNDTIHVKDEK
jgi:hypothetical protein